MNLLIVAATELEIAPLRHQNLSADFLITGVGIPATVFHLTKTLMSKNYNLALQAGIAGSFKNSIPLGDVVLVKKDAFGDLGIEENGDFKTLTETGFLGNNEPPYEEGFLANNSSFLKEQSLPLVNAITINKITNDLLHLKKIQQKFNAGIESMEGAAFHYVCLQHKIDFLQVRSISNHVGERDKTKWEMKKAISNLNEEVLKIIKHL